MTTINAHLSIITLNMKAFKSLTKRHKLADWIRKHDATLCSLEGDSILRQKNGKGYSRQITVRSKQE